MSIHQITTNVVVLALTDNGKMKSINQAARNAFKVKFYENLDKKVIYAPLVPQVRTIHTMDILETVCSV